MQAGIDTAFIYERGQTTAVRSWILQRSAWVPDARDSMRIERGYLSIERDGSQSYIEHRLFEGSPPQYMRAILTADGEHTREPITEEQFLRQWPQTEEFRIHKIRHHIMSGGDVVLYCDVYVDESWGLKLLIAKFGNPALARAFVLPDDVHGALEINPDAITDVQLAKDPAMFNVFFIENHR